MTGNCLVSNAHLVRCESPLFIPTAGTGMATAEAESLSLLGPHKSYQTKLWKEKKAESNGRCDVISPRYSWRFRVLTKGLSIEAN